MGKGENIFKRKDGRWEARYAKGRGIDGGIIYGYCYGKTYREAKEKVTVRKADVLFGIQAEAARTLRLGHYCDEWLQKKKPVIKESTYIKYWKVLEKHIKPALGNCKPKSITEEAVNFFVGDLEARLSAKTIKDVLAVLRAVLKYSGCTRELAVPLPKEQSREARVLSQSEQSVLIQRLSGSQDRRDLGTLLVLLTGIRIGELCALRWEDVSMEDDTIHIRSTIQRLSDENGGTRIIISTPKSDKSRRVIPMTQIASAVCRRMEPGEGFLLTGSERYLEPRAMQYHLQRITKECGLEGVHFHTLRHTFATRCMEVGFDIKSLSEILGHSTTGITLDRYIHASLALKRENMKKLDQVGM